MKYAIVLLVALCAGTANAATFDQIQKACNKLADLADAAVTARATGVSEKRAKMAFLNGYLSTRTSDPKVASIALEIIDGAYLIPLTDETAKEYPRRVFMVCMKDLAGV